MPAAGESERAPNIAKDVWDAAGIRAKSEGLPLIWIMSRALAEYAAGTLSLSRTATGARAGSRRGRSIFATDAVWSGADEQRAKDRIRSMSALCEILLDAYARGEIHPYARMVTTAQRDALAAPSTPDGATPGPSLPAAA
ncbi:hypothetical protein [Streptomyces minutiscleroticus]|uniref:Uncharacterized protein n=1 Tax=Streptomyces minutiscleroticus TaxID=68238 RepID=A0A918U729_9ACTN|nr:hypothetical protein [Streptomyces minutiscleroticus]GGY02943.1 hypothetical protein GCM10010358_65830 [Streptomyces minutiscleroticus]